MLKEAANEQIYWLDENLTQLWDMEIINAVLLATDYATWYCSFSPHLQFKNGIKIIYKAKLLLGHKDREWSPHTIKRPRTMASKKMTMQGHN